MKRALIGVSIVAALGFASLAWGEDVVTQPIRTFGLGELWSAAYSPDGQHIATCGSQGAFLWDIETGAVVRTFTGHTWYVASVAFSPDAKVLLTGSWDNSARV